MYSRVSSTSDTAIVSDPQTGRSGRPHRAGAEVDKRTLFERLVDFLSPGIDSRAELIETLADAEQRSLIEPESRAMLEGVLRMADRTAGDVMVAATRMDLLAIDAPYDELLAAVIGTGHSRFPVYEGQRENILGTLMAKDLLKLQRAPGLNLRTLLRPPVFVPESKGLNELLREFRSNRNHLAIVIDEFGNTAGLITIEDVLEEIVGEIEDEFDDADVDSGVYALADGSMRVAGDVTIAQVNQAFDVKLPEDAFDTIGGIVSHELGHVPRRGEAMRIGGLHFTVMLTRGGAVRWFKVTRPAADGATPHPRRVRRVSGATRVPRAPNRGLLRPLLPGGAGVAAALLAGVAQALSFAPIELWWLQILATGALVALLVDETPRAAALRGWAFGVGWLVAGLWWLYISLPCLRLPAGVVVGGGGRGAGGVAVALLRAGRLGLGRACGASGRWSTRCCSRPSGCSPSWRAASCSPASRGSPRATRTRRAR